MLGLIYIVYFHVLVSKIRHNFFDIQPHHITMKLDLIVFQFMKVIDSLPALLCTGACSPSVSITDLPQFQRQWLCEETWQPRSLEIQDLSVECTDSGVKLKLNRRSN